MSNLGKLFDKTGPYSAKSLSKKKKKKSAAAKPAPPAKESKKKDKPKKKVTPQQWKDLGESLTKTADKLSKTESSERAKTQDLKDKLYIQKSKRRKS